MALQSVLPVPQRRGINHADFSIDGGYAIFTCEFEGSLVKIDTEVPKVLGVLNLSTSGMPQDIRLSPDGKVFYVADMMADGVFLIDGDAFSEIGFVATGIGAHGLYPSRDGIELYVSSRGSHQVHGSSHGPGRQVCRIGPVGKRPFAEPGQKFRRTLSRRRGTHSAAGRSRRRHS